MVSSTQCGLTAGEYGKRLATLLKLVFLPLVLLKLAIFVACLIPPTSKVSCILYPRKQNCINKCKHVLEISNGTGTLFGCLVFSFLFFSFSRYFKHYK